MSDDIRRYIRIIEDENHVDRLKRARSQGFDVDHPVYHGTRAGEFSAFRIAYRRNEQLGFGIHVTLDPGFAEKYAHDLSIARRGKSPFVYHLYARLGNVLDANSIVKKGSPEFDLCMKLAGSRAMKQNDENGIPCIYVQNSIDSTSGQRAERLIKAAGYDSIKYQAKIRKRTAYGSYIVNHPPPEGGGF